MEMKMNYGPKMDLGEINGYVSQSLSPLKLLNKDRAGLHYLAEFYGCNISKLNDVEYIERVFVYAALEAGMEVREVCFHQFAPYGVSGVVIVSESHLAMHGWPENGGYAAVDVFTCGNSDPGLAIKYISKELEAKKVMIDVCSRGSNISNEVEKLYQEYPEKKQEVNTFIKAYNKKPC